jgi:TPR repeat protein
MYENGQRVKQDSKEAVNWYRQAADKGVAGGQSSISRISEKSQGAK